MIIKVILKPPFENSVIEFNHRLKFNPSKSSKKPYISQSYDEIIINMAGEVGLTEFEKFRTNNENGGHYVNLTNVDPELHDLVNTLNEGQQLDITEHDEIFEKAIEFVDEEIKKIKEKIVSTEKDIKDKYKNLLVTLDN